MDSIIVLLIYFLGAFVGSVITNLIYMFYKVSGTLRIDHTDPDKDFYSFEIDDLDSLSKQSRIILKVRHETDLSQK